MKTTTNSGGRTQQNLQKLNLLNHLAGLVVRSWDSKDALQAAIALQTFRDSPDLLKLRGGIETMHLAQMIIKGTEWEEILFPKPQSSDDKRVLKKFRQECDKKWPNDL